MSQKKYKEVFPCELCNQLNPGSWQWQICQASCDDTTDDKTTTKSLPLKTQQQHCINACTTKKCIKKCQLQYPNQ